MSSTRRLGQNAIVAEERSIARTRTIRLGDCNVVSCAPDNAAAAALEIRLLGPMQVARAGVLLALPPSKKTRALLGYLVATAREHRRERLCSLLWDVADDPRGALRWSLSKLRAVVDERGMARIATDRDRISFVGHDANIDVTIVRRCAQRGVDAVATEALEEALEQFRGELLEGLDLTEFHDFQGWLVAQREWARSLRRTLARTLTQRHAGEPTRALTYARTWVDVDPLDLRARTELARLLGEAGHGPEAREQLVLAVRRFKAQSAPGVDVLEATLRRVKG